MTKLRKRGTVAFFTTITTFALLIAVAATIWGLTSDVLRSATIGHGDQDQTNDASRYISKRPFDPVGWLAWAGTRGLLAKDAALAARVVNAAATLGPVDPQVLRAQALLAFQQGRVDVGLVRMADLAVIFPAEAGDSFAALRAHATHPEWKQFWDAQLLKRWPAVDSFLLHSCQSGAPLATLFAIAQPAVSKQPLTDATVKCIGNKAISEGRVPAAHWLWINAMQTSPRSLGNVFNGDFEQLVTGHLFDWRFAPGGEYREGFAATVSRDDSSSTRSRNQTNSDNHVLSIRFNGRALTLPIAQQYLALTPGRYALTYRSSESGAIVPGTVKWTIRCVPAAATPILGVVRSAPALAGWTTNTIDVIIPEACTGQLLDLEAGDRLQLLQGYRGTVAFDDISMKRTQ